MKLKQSKAYWCLVVDIQYVYVIVCMCVEGGIGLEASMQGWVHCVTAHVHSPPSVCARLCMFSFFALLRNEIVETCPPNAF